MANTIAVTEANAGTTPGLKITSDDPNLATSGSVTITSDDGSTSVVINGLRDALLAYFMAIIDAIR